MEIIPPVVVQFFKPIERKSPAAQPSTSWGMASTEEEVADVGDNKLPSLSPSLSPLWQKGFVLSIKVMVLLPIKVHYLKQNTVNVVLNVIIGNTIGLQ